jgi:hypothetical protein
MQLAGRSRRRWSRKRTLHRRSPSPYLCSARTPIRRLVTLIIHKNDMEAVWGLVICRRADPMARSRAIANARRRPAVCPPQHPREHYFFHVAPQKRARRLHYVGSRSRRSPVGPLPWRCGCMLHAVSGRCKINDSREIPRGSSTGLPCGISFGHSPPHR